MKKVNGFTLIEVMISITIIGVIGIISAAIFTQTLKTSTQTEALSNLKQNGEQAVNVMDEVIRNAQAVVCYGPSSGTTKDTLVIRTIEGKYIKFRFSSPVSSGATITQNGYIARQDDLNPTLLSTFCTAAPNTSLEAALTNKDISSGVSISDGKFEPISNGLGKDTIKISFNVNKTRTTSGDAGQTAFISTTIQVR